MLICVVFIRMDIAVHERLLVMGRLSLKRSIRDSEKCMESGKRFCFLKIMVRTLYLLVLSICTVHIDRWVHCYSNDELDLSHLRLVWVLFAKFSLLKIFKTIWIKGVQVLIPQIQVDKSSTGLVLVILLIIISTIIAAVTIIVVVIIVIIFITI